jgi:hypothetical protein
VSKRRGPTGPDHRAAWAACRKPDVWGDDATELNLRALLDKRLKAGWSIPALKAYAYCHWRYTGRDHVTPAARRLAVWAAYDDSTARSFLEDFNSDPERYAGFVK